MEEEDNIIDKADRISGLPDSTVHYILSFLNCPKTLIRMSVLSKHWFSLTASFPILKFNIRTLLDRKGPFNYNSYRDVMDVFLKYVVYTTSRFCKQNDDNAHTYSIYTRALRPSEVDILDRYLRLILKRGVQVLVIDINAININTYEEKLYRLPNTLLSASSLTSMTIRECKLPSSLKVDDMKFKSLKYLSLDLVPINEGVIKCLITGCPLLEEIIIKRCDGLERFCIFGLPNLKKARIYGNGEIESVDIEAPNLCYLLIENSKGSAAPFMKLFSCRKLKSFCYYGFLSKEFTNSLSSFPVIENLILCLSSHRDSLKLSVHSLRRLIFRSTCDLENIVIDTPNLISFDFYGKYKKDVNSLSMEYSSQSKACMNYDTNKLVDTLWFPKFRQFLDKHNGFKILKLFITAKSVDITKLKMLDTSPYELEHLELHLGNKQKNRILEAVVDAVLWCCRPRSLTLRLNKCFHVFTTRTYDVKYTYEKLLQQEDQEQYNIRIVLCYPSEAKQHFNDVNSMLESLTRDQPIDTITFIKEEVI